MSASPTVIPTPTPEPVRVDRIHVDVLKRILDDRNVAPAFRAALEPEIERAHQVTAAAVDPALTLFLAAMDVMRVLCFQELLDAGAIRDGIDHLLYVRDPLMWIGKTRAEAPGRLAAWWLLVQQTLDPWHRSGIVPCAHASGA